jgi:hypothetical protein
MPLGLMDTCYLVWQNLAEKLIFGLILEVYKLVA